jgi:hypothetical protein
MRELADGSENKPSHVDERVAGRINDLDIQVELRPATLSQPDVRK